jgi:hypothetical protein
MRIRAAFATFGLFLAVTSRAEAQSPVNPIFLFGPVNGPGVQAPVSVSPDAAGRLPGSLIIQVVISGTANVTISGTIDNLPFASLPILNASGQSVTAITSSGDYWIPALQSIQATVNSVSGMVRASMVSSTGAFVALNVLPSAITVAKNSSVSIAANANGTSGSPVSVTTATPVKAITGSVNRKSYTLYSESSDLRCMPGTTADTANAIAPTSRVGFLIRSATYTKEDIAPGNRLDCIAVTATSNVDTWEEN